MDALNPEAIPWWAKLAAKIVLSRLPVSYDRWRSLGIFRHGAMHQTSYALDVFMRHYTRAQPYLAPGFVALELGPGDSLASALIARAFGASRTYLVDAGPFASGTAVARYNDLCDALAERGRPIAGAPFTTVDAMLAAVGATYLTRGLDSLRSIASQSVELVFSQAVLEHIALDEFDATIAELYRISRPGGVSSHRVDLQDHLAHGLNSLRFSRSIWESRLFATSGFYTNRLRARDVVDGFTRAGFVVLERVDERWPSLPLRPRQLHPDFAALPESELLIRGFDLLACR